MTIIINVGNNAFGGNIVSNDEYEKNKTNKVCIQLHMSYFNVSSLYYCTKDCTRFKFLMKYGLDSVIFESLKSGTQA